MKRMSSRKAKGRSGTTLSAGIVARRQAEEQPGVDQVHLSMALEAAGVVTWEWDIPTGSIRYSDNLQDIVGETAAEPYCSLDSLLEQLHPDDRRGLVQALDRAAKQGNPFECEYRVGVLDGTYRWILGRGKIVVWEDGKPSRVRGLSIDISRLKRAQEATRAGEARFRLLANTATRLLATQDPQSLVTQLCRELMEYLDCQLFLNYLTEDLSHPSAGDTTVFILPTRLHLNACAGISEEQARAIEWIDFDKAVCSDMARDGRPFVAENIQASEAPRTASVKRLGVRGYCCNPLLSEGRILGTLSFGRTTRPGFAREEVELMRAFADVVAVAFRRMKMRKALETTRAEAINEKNRLAAVMETLPVGVCILDAQGGIVRTNQAYKDIWGGPLPPVRGVSDYIVYEARWAATGKPVQPEEWASARAVQHGETVVNQELQIQRFDGTRGYVLNSAAPIRDAHSRIIGCAVAIRDITERKQAEELHRQLESRVQQAQKEESLGVLAGGIAHDFNNLLTVIMGNIGLASGELSPDSRAGQFLGKAEEASRHAASLCQQLLAYVGKTALAFRPVQLNQVLQEMTCLIAASLSKNAEVRWNLADGLPLVHADPNQLQQVIMNLLINASEAIGNQPGQITLTTGSAGCAAPDLESPWVQDPLPAGDYVFLEVADTGHGIEASVLTRVFEPFFSTKFTGRGLGLAAVLGIVRSHHGSIQVRSSPGRGATFRVWLPAVAGELTAPEPLRSTARNWTGSGTILVVDDEDAVRSAAECMLEVLGFQTVPAADGPEAIEIYRADPERFWCVLLDATMPKLDGEATFEELSHIRPDVRVILSSGFSKNDIMARFAGRRLAGFLPKPYTLENLAAALQNLNGNQGPHDKTKPWPSAELPAT